MFQNCACDHTVTGLKLCLVWENLGEENEWMSLSLPVTITAEEPWGRKQIQSFILTCVSFHLLLNVAHKTSLAVFHKLLLMSASPKLRKNTKYFFFDTFKTEILYFFQHYIFLTAVGMNSSMLLIKIWHKNRWSVYRKQCIPTAQTTWLPANNASATITQYF